jgi:hypothetical protein
VRRLDAALELSREEELPDAQVAPFKALLTRNSVGAMQRRRRAAALQGASRIFMVSRRSSAAEHQRLLCNRRFHPFHVYNEKKRREKLNPVRRGRVSSPGDRPWSSWRYYSTCPCSACIDWTERAAQTCHFGTSPTPKGRSLRQPARHARERLVGWARAGLISLDVYTENGFHPFSD